VQEKAPVQTFWMRRKLFAHILDANQGNEFIQTSWTRIRSSWFDRYECTARLCSNSLDAKEGLLKKKRKKQKQGICSNMLVRINTFVRTCWLCKKRHLFKHFGCKGSYLLTFWMRTKAFVQTLWMKSRIASKILDTKQRDLFERFGCTAGFVQTI